MCGIVGYIGDREAAAIVLDGLSRLEYRGYDSAGIAVRERKSGQINIVKAKGRLEHLISKTEQGSVLSGKCGIGHTRWATHGEPTEQNAHPHCSDDQRVVLVHNGIIENYLELKEMLIEVGYEFYSQTDTEVACKLINHLGKESGGDHLYVISKALDQLKGSYALAIMFQDSPDKLYAVRKDSPLIVGIGQSENFIASDVPAILKYTREIAYLDDFEIAVLEKNAVSFYNKSGEPCKKTYERITLDVKAVEKDGFDHFMLKEIYEQPKVVEDTLRRYTEAVVVNMVDNIFANMDEYLERIYIVACGSAYHVGVSAKYVIEDLAHIPVEVDLASEFRYRNPVLVKNSLVIVISQSGETADSLAALRLAKSKGVKIMGIVNVIGSAIAREADLCMYTYAGPEISVATTKAYSTQLIVIYLLAIALGRKNGVIPDIQAKEMLKELESIPEKMQMILDEKEKIQDLAELFTEVSDVFFMGRGLDYGTAMEGSLKLKEISYIHAESYAAGEMKHGTISLIEEGTWVIGIMTQSDLQEKMLSNMMEVKSRGARLLAIITETQNNMRADMEDIFDYVIYVPKTADCFAPSLSILPLQLFSYYVSESKGLDVDKPRNLAKSVTVE